MADVQDVCYTTHFGSKEDHLSTHLMIIENVFNKIQSAKPEEALESGTFECGNIQFKLKIYPNGSTKEAEGIISVNIEIMNRGKTQWKSIEIFAAENSEGSFLKTHLVVFENINRVKCQKPELGFLLPRFLPHPLVLAQKYSPFFPKGVFTIKVNIKVRGEETITFKAIEFPDESIITAELKGELSSHFRKMLNTQQFSDFQIICQGESIPCHRNVLAARSDIFRAMLDHNMKENETGEVEIEDFDLVTVKAIITYIYTGEVEHLENFEQLMRAADKYQLEGLKKMIEATLIKTVKIANAIDMFVLGDAVHADKLREVSKDVIVRNVAAIVEIDGWKKALGRFQDLTLEIFESVVKTKTQKK